MVDFLNIKLNKLEHCCEIDVGVLNWRAFDRVSYKTHYKYVDGTCNYQNPKYLKHMHYGFTNVFDCSCL